MCLPHTVMESFGQKLHIEAWIAGKRRCPADAVGAIEVWEKGYVKNGVFEIANMMVTVIIVRVLYFWLS